MLADCLSDRRFEVVDLGANTPTESFVEVAEESDRLIGVGLCAVADAVVSNAVEQVKQLRDALPDTYLLVGGEPIAAAAERFTPFVDLVSADAQEACDAFGAGVDGLGVFL